MGTANAAGAKNAAAAAAAAGAAAAAADAEAIAAAAARARAGLFGMASSAVPWSLSPPPPLSFQQAAGEDRVPAAGLFGVLKIAIGGIRVRPKPSRLR